MEHERCQLLLFGVNPWVFLQFCYHLQKKGLLRIFSIDLYLYLQDSNRSVTAIDGLMQTKLSLLDDSLVVPVPPDLRMALVCDRPLLFGVVIFIVQPKVLCFNLNQL